VVFGETNMAGKARPRKAKPTINLYGARGPGLIIRYPSGVIYSNQTGGHCCHHPIVEGVFVPLETDSTRYYRLTTHFFGGKYHGWCNGIDEEDADIIDEILQGESEAPLIVVDRTKLKKCEEAWIHVKVSELAKSRWTSISVLFRGFGRARGILTWQNSD
jgi:hypothetical protein